MYCLIISNLRRKDTIFYLYLCGHTKIMKKTITFILLLAFAASVLAQSSLQKADYSKSRRAVRLVAYNVGVFSKYMGDSMLDVASMMQELVSLIASGRQKENVSNATQAIDSHLIAFAAEESRLANGKVIEL